VPPPMGVFFYQFKFCGKSFFLSLNFFSFLHEREFFLCPSIVCHRQFDQNWHLRFHLEKRACRLLLPPSFSSSSCECKLLFRSGKTTLLRSTRPSVSAPKSFSLLTLILYTFLLTVPPSINFSWNSSCHRSPQRPAPTLNIKIFHFLTSSPLLFLFFLLAIRNVPSCPTLEI